MPKDPRSKNQKRRERNKEKKVKARAASEAASEAGDAQAPEALEGTAPAVEPMDTKAEFEEEEDTPFVGVDTENPWYAYYKNILILPGATDASSEAPKKPEVYYDEDDDIPEEEEKTQGKKMSRKARKAANKLSVAELKALVKKPELVEWTDTSSPDPLLHVHLKGTRNAIPVPEHWGFKREYLSNKRGIEKPQYKLPDFILETGIAEMRDATLEKQEQQTLKQKQRERVQGKTGKMDLDYQKAYNAFFKVQKKPPLTRFGEVYYEGKEFETNLRHVKPGELSEDLKAALSIPPGAPPPWLINQQRFGPPPSYPYLKIPGLNAPLPPGANWGFHPGGYGKPPTDELGKPLYGGDLFGQEQPEPPAPAGVPIERTLWGELEPEKDESEDEEEESDEEEDEDEDMDGEGLQTPSGLDTPSGVASAMPSEYGGAESVAGDFELRKQRPRGEQEAPRSAYQVLPEQSIRAQGFFGGERAYDLKSAQQNLPVLGQEDNKRKRKVGDVDVSVDPDALQKDDRLTKDEIQKRYEAQRKQENQGIWGGPVDQEDLSDMIAQETRKRAKREEQHSKSRR